MRIGELAQRSGVTVRTVHYYIEQGLLPAPPRQGKYGDFDESYLQRLRLIRQLKAQRLSLPAIRERLLEMGLGPSPLTPAAFGGTPSFLSPSAGEGERGEGLFRSRFAEEAGLTPEQVARLEALGLLASSEGLIPTSALPLARAASSLLASGASLEDVARISEQVRQEAALHRRLLNRTQGEDPLVQALQWQEQVGAVGTIRQILLWRWAHSGQEGL